MKIYTEGLPVAKCCGDCFFNRQTRDGWKCTVAFPDRWRDFGSPLEKPNWCPWKGTDKDLINRKELELTDFEIISCNGDYKEALKILLDKIDNAPSINE